MEKRLSKSRILSFLYQDKAEGDFLLGKIKALKANVLFFGFIYFFLWLIKIINNRFEVPPTGPAGLIELYWLLPTIISVVFSGFLHWAILKLVKLFYIYCALFYAIYLVLKFLFLTYLSVLFYLACRGYFESTNSRLTNTGIIVTMIYVLLYIVFWINIHGYKRKAAAIIFHFCFVVFLSIALDENQTTRDIINKLLFMLVMIITLIQVVRIDFQVKEFGLKESTIEKDKTWQNILNNMSYGISILSMKNEFSVTYKNSYFDQLFEIPSEMVSGVDVYNKLNRKVENLKLFSRSSRHSKTFKFNATMTKPTQMKGGLVDLEQTLKHLNQSGNIKHEFALITGEFVRENLDNSSIIAKMIIEIKITTIKFCGEDSLMLLIDDISQRQVINSLIEMNEYKLQLLSSFSHEMRTPLNGALPLLEDALQEENISEELKKLYILQPRNSLRILNNVISDFIDFSLISSNQFYLKIEKFSINSLVDDVISLFELHASEKSLNLEKCIDPNISDDFSSDQQRVKQVLINLISNAVKFTTKGSICLRAKTINTPLQNQILFEVEDTGVGISDDRLIRLRNLLDEPDIHNPYTKLNNTGSSLGLIISQNIVLQLSPDHTSGITVESEENRGSKFSFIVEKNNNTGNIFEMKKYHFNHLKKKFSITKHNLSQGMIPERTSEPSKSSIGNQKELMKDTIYLEMEPCSMRNGFSENQNSQKNLMKNENGSLIEFDSSSSERLSERRNGDDNIDKMLFSHYFQDIQRSSARDSITPNMNVTKKKKKLIFNFNPPTLNVSRDDNITDRPLNSALKKSIYPTRSSTSSPFKFDQRLSKKCTCQKALIVDDDAFNLLSLEKILNKIGLKCVKATNGSDAVDICKKRELDKCEAGDFCLGICLIIMDYQMPIMDGVCATRVLVGMMSEKEIPTVPIIGCSAFQSRIDVENCMNAGMKDYINKPITLQKIKEVYETHVLQKK